MEKDLNPPLPPPSPNPEPDPPFSNDISRMSDIPPRATAHRRAHSEILSLPDDLSFDNDLGVVHDANGVGPSLSDEAPDDDLLSVYLDLDKFPTSSSSSSSVAAAPPPPPAAAESSGRPSRPRHHHSQSMDGSSSSSSVVKSEMPVSGGDGAAPSLAEAKKAMSAAKLADLALVDPKRAKRIWANRQSAARSKERKMRYIAELERKVQTLQTEATTLSAQLTMLQRDTTGLTAENSELKLRLQTMEQQVHLQDALNDALREEVQRLKLMTGQVLANGGQMMNYGSTSFGGNQPQFYPQNNTMQSMLAAHQLQQLHLHSHQQQMHPNQLQQQPQQQPQQQQQQMVPQSPSDMKSKAPMISANQSQRDGAFEANHSMAKD